MEMAGKLVFLTFYLLLPTCRSNNIFPTIKMDMNEHLIVSAVYTLHLDLHVSLDIYIYLLYMNELLKGWKLG